MDAGETDRDGGQESLRDVGDDNADEKDDGVEPEIAEQERDHEERDSEKEQTGALGHVTPQRSCDSRNVMSAFRRAITIMWIVKPGMCRKTTSSRPRPRPV